jgi:hypothetical protein
MLRMYLSEAAGVLLTRVPKWSFSRDDFTYDHARDLYRCP